MTARTPRWRRVVAEVVVTAVGGFVWFVIMGGPAALVGGQ